MFIDMPRCEMFYIWAVGGRSFYTPKEVGFQIGTNFNNIIMQVHYDNPFELKNQFDSSGVKILSTKNHRKYSAGILILGVNLPQIAIPPKNPSYVLKNECNNTCSTSAIKLFSYGFHMHQIGSKMRTEIYRNEKLYSLVFDDEYDFNSQDLVRFDEDLTVEKNDRFVTTCEWNSKDRVDVTRGGLPSQSEMCFNYVFFYPKFSGPRTCISKSCVLTT